LIVNLRGPGPERSRETQRSHGSLKFPDTGLHGHSDYNCFASVALRIPGRPLVKQAGGF